MTAHGEGAAAYHRGDCLNPHDFDTPGFTAWQEGWREESRAYLDEAIADEDARGVWLAAEVELSDARMADFKQRLAEMS